MECAYIESINDVLLKLPHFCNLYIILLYNSIIYCVSILKDKIRCRDKSSKGINVLYYKCAHYKCALILK